MGGDNGLSGTLSVPFALGRELRHVMLSTRAKFVLDDGKHLRCTCVVRLTSRRDNLMHGKCATVSLSC